ncbi:NAD-dependent epimerase/dehydratase family protein [Paenibacillaceae bacterium WGS1546]|uniref:NAD-dependent epimerase/dehydratase family protein n=1 Tax=Cohnella sp. WGS1546 TaxID=3366810 RepID=UPI00372D001E
MMPGRILITGAGGFTGGHACRHFSAAGWEVVAAVSPRSRACKLDARETASCELTDGEAAAELVRRVRPDAVLHLAGRNAVDASWKAPAASLAANLMSTAYLLEAVRSLGTGRVLVVGSMIGADESRLSEAAHPYGFSKALQVAASVAWSRWYELPVMIAEPSNLIGPGCSSGLCGKIARWAAAAEEAEGRLPPFALSSLRESRDFLDVRDAVEGYERVIRDGVPGERYALESGTFRTLEEVKRTFDESTATALPWTVGSGSPAPSPTARDTSSIRKLGWAPKRAFRQSIRDALEEERRRRRRERERGGSPFRSESS